MVGAIAAGLVGAHLPPSLTVAAVGVGTTGFGGTWRRRVAVRAPWGLGAVAASRREHRPGRRSGRRPTRTLPKRTVVPRHPSPSRCGHRVEAVVVAAVVVVDAVAEVEAVVGLEVALVGVPLCGHSRREGGVRAGMRAGTHTLDHLNHMHRDRHNRNAHETMGTARQATIPSDSSAGDGSDGRDQGELYHWFDTFDWRARTGQWSDP